MQLVTNRNELGDVIIWVDGSADNPKEDANPMSGCSAWFADNWYVSHQSPFTKVPEMADITSRMNKNVNETHLKHYLSSTQIQGSTKIFIAPKVAP